MVIDFSLVSEATFSSESNAIMELIIFWNLSGSDILIFTIQLINSYISWFLVSEMSADSMRLLLEPAMMVSHLVWIFLSLSDRYCLDNALWLIPQLRSSLQIKIDCWRFFRLSSSLRERGNSWSETLIRLPADLALLCLESVPCLDSAPLFLLLSGCSNM